MTESGISVEQTAKAHGDPAEPVMLGALFGLLAGAGIGFMVGGIPGAIIGAFLGLLGGGAVGAAITHQRYG